MAYQRSARPRRKDREARGYRSAVASVKSQLRATSDASTKARHDTREDHRPDEAQRPSIRIRGALAGTLEHRESELGQSVDESPARTQPAHSCRALTNSRAEQLEFGSSANQSNQALELEPHFSSTAIEALFSARRDGDDRA